MVCALSIYSISSILMHPGVYSIKVIDARGKVQYACTISPVNINAVVSAKTLVYMNTTTQCLIKS